VYEDVKMKIDDDIQIGHSKIEKSIFLPTPEPLGYNKGIAILQNNLF